MRKFILAGLATLMLCVVALADVQIDTQHRTQNQSPGYCAWACLETLGRNQGIKQLEGLVEARTKDGDVTEKRMVQIGSNLWEERTTVIATKNVGYLPEIRRKLD